MITQQHDIITPVNEPLADALTLIGPVHLKSYFERHSRTFSFAARWFDEDQRWAVRRIYAFCRFTDDLVDTSTGSPEQALFLVNQWEKIVRNVYAGSVSGIGWLDDLLHASRKRGVRLEWISDLIAGIRFDTGTVRMQSEGELHRYCYQVASTVGLWVCVMCQVNNPFLLERAIELGRAMQLTNIIRDVGEDLDRDRLYIPETLLTRRGLQPNELFSSKNSIASDPRYQAVIGDLIEMANGFYEQSWKGIYRLPFRMGLATSVASQTYRAIGDSVVKNDYDNLSKRAFTTYPRKLGATAVAVSRFVGGLTVSRWVRD